MTTPKIEELIALLHEHAAQQYELSRLPLGHAYTQAANALQSQAERIKELEAKMVPLEKDAARYRWWCDTGNDILAKDTIGGKPTIDAAIDAAMGITGEPK